MEAMGMETMEGRMRGGGWRHSRLLKIEIHQRNGRRVVSPGFWGMKPGQVDAGGESSRLRAGSVAASERLW